MGDLGQPDWAGRLRRLRETSATKGRAALLVTAPPNIRYLTGFSASTGFLLIGPDRAALLLDGRYIAQARAAAAAGELAPLEIVDWSGRSSKALADVLSRWRPGSIGVEADHVTLAALAQWQTASPDRAFEAVSGPVESLRRVKDPFELDILRRGGRAIASVARGLGELVASGRTELEVASLIDESLRRAGFERTAFPTIVASGPNSALPHARPTDRRCRAGDLVLLDFGGVLDGYCVDLTRMVAVGRPTASAAALVRAVQEAHTAALAVVRAGIETWRVDQAARDTLARLGWGDGIRHATGHGLGLELHEAPRIGPADPDLDGDVARLDAGMVCTIEPGAYVDGLGGARLEDDVLVTAGGCEVLTDAPRELVVVRP
jgi:Xaa-Pro aminopeptidase